MKYTPEELEELFDALWVIVESTSMKTYELMQRIEEMEKRFLGMRQRIDEIQEAHNLW